MSYLFLVAGTAPGAMVLLQSCPHLTGLDGPFFYAFNVRGPFLGRNHRLCGGVHSHAYAKNKSGAFLAVFGVLATTFCPLTTRNALRPFSRCA